jgi:hypothetical protein
MSKAVIFASRFRPRHTRNPREESPTKMRDKPAKPADKPNSSRRPQARRREPYHGDVSKRAYFLHLEEGEHDALGNWLRGARAENGLTTVSWSWGERAEGRGRGADG